MKVSFRLKFICILMKKIENIVSFMRCANAFSIASVVHNSEQLE